VSVKETEDICITGKTMLTLNAETNVTALNHRTNCQVSFSLCYLATVEVT